MIINRKKNITRSVFVGLFSKIIILLFQFLMKTIIIRTLGILYLGLNSLFTSVLGVLNLSELGIGSIIVFSMYRYIAEDDIDNLKALLNFYRKCYFIVGIIITIFGLCFIPFLKKIIGGEYPDDINLYIAYIINLLSTSLGYFLFSYKTSILEAYQRNDLVSKIETATIIIQSSLQIVLLLIFKNYYLYLIVIPMTTVIRNVSIYYITNKYFPEFKYNNRLQKLELEVIQIIKKQFKGVLFHKFGKAIFQYADSLVISSFLGLKVLGIYNNYYYVISALVGFISIINTTLIPGVGNGTIVNDFKKNKDDYFMINMLYYWISTICSVILLCLYQPFITLWIGKDFLFDNYPVFYLVLLFFWLNFPNVNGVYKGALGIWWEDRFRPIVSASVNLSLNLILIKKIGINGVLISSIVTMMFIDFPYLSFIIFKYYFKESPIKYILKQLLRFIAIIPIAILCFSICQKIEISNIFGLFLKFIISFLLSNAFFIILNFHDKSFKMLAETIFNYFKKIKRGKKV